MKKGVLKSTKEQVAEMFKLKAKGWSYSAIGKKLHRDRTTVMYWAKKYEKNTSDGIPVLITATSKELDSMGKKRKKNNPYKTGLTLVPISYEEFVKEIELKRKQRNCPHKAMSNNKCFMCGLVKIN